jgi:tetratricopeptide (TPR) repeat protein
MEINKLIEANQKESIGKYFFSKATTFALNKEFGKSYEYFKEGLDIITCDCVRGGWLKAYAESDKKLFDDINIKHMPHFEYFFVKAYMMSYEEDKKSLYSALDAIDKYLILQDDDYGHYVRGKILLGLEESREAFDCFYSASSFSKNQRLLYRLGRTKEQLLGENGLEELFNSFIKNPLSACCARLLKKYMKERGETLAIPKVCQIYLLLHLMMMKMSGIFKDSMRNYLKASLKMKMICLLK